jgi:hypothetical protein
LDDTVSNPLTPKLTDLQAQALELKDRERLTWVEMGERMNVGKSSARNAYMGAIRKLKTFSDGPDDSQLEHHFEEFVNTLGAPSDKDFVALLEAGALKALWRLVHAPEVMAKLTGKDLAAVAGNLLEKRQLLKGEPTAITRFQDIRKLDEVAEMLNSELKRRGKMIDVVAEEV